MDALKDILSKVEHGEKIDVISMSASIINSRNDYVGKEEIIKQYNAITTKLKSLGCEIITSDDFWRNGFSYAYKIDNLVDNKNLDNYVSVYAGKNNEKVNVLDAGKCVPFVFTENDYIYSGCKGSASYSIPQVSSMLALAKQIKNDITFEEFSMLAQKTCATNKNGTKFVDMVSLIKNLEITNEVQEEITKQ